MLTLLCAIPAAGPQRWPPHLSSQEERLMERRLWSQVVATASGLPANVVAVWSQFGLCDSTSSQFAGPLSCGFAGAPRGIRTPNRQIRSLVTLWALQIPLGYRRTVDGVVGARK